MNPKSNVHPVKLKKLDSFLREYYRIDEIDDPSLNGIQFPGAENIEKIAFSVDASLYTLVKARENNCQLLLVHHGIMWKGAMENRIDNFYKARLKEMILGDLSLYAIHLPMDLHPEIGHNALILKGLGGKNQKPAFPYRGINIGYIGELEKEENMDAIVKKLEKMDIPSTVYPLGKEKIKSIGIASGGSSSSVSVAIDLGIDLFITGEFHHSSWHPAKEGSINVIAGGHYHTEVPGIKAVMALIKEKFDIDTIFIDAPTNL